MLGRPCSAFGVGILYPKFFKHLQLQRFHFARFCRRLVVVTEQVQGAVDGQVGPMLEWRLALRLGLARDAGSAC